MSIRSNPVFATAAVAVAVLLLSGCATTEPLVHSAQFAPMYPVPIEKATVPTGAIYNGRQSDSWFGHRRDYVVGDVLTVLLEESTQSARQQTGTVSRKSTNDVVPSGLTTKIGGLGSVLGGLNLNRANVESNGTGNANQRATLQGAVSVTVVEVLANGNLVIRGEKQIAFSEGSEVIQVSGIIRAQDISPNNTVQSRRLANAQFAYRGSGDLAQAAKAGWGTGALLRFWPF